MCPQMNAFRPTSVSRACVLLMSISGENTEGGNGMPGNIVDMILVWCWTCVCLAYKCVYVCVRTLFRPKLEHGAANKSSGAAHTKAPYLRRCGWQSLAVGRGR